MVSENGAGVSHFVMLTHLRQENARLKEQLRVLQVDLEAMVLASDDPEAPSTLDSLD